jgi:hypothetical protein
MTSINFPDNPTLNQTFTVGERTWKWTGTSWDVVVTTVVIGPQGPQGIAGAGVATGGTAGQILIKASSNDFDTTWTNNQKISYTHGQTATSATWTIVHNLGFNPNVTVKDNYGNVIEGYITYNDSNTLTVEFSNPLSGYAYLS